MTSWRDLQIGDQIRFLRMPSEYSLTNYLAPETLALYDLLIATTDPIYVTSFDQFGAPLVEYTDRRNSEEPVFHILAIHDADDGAWEMVSTSP